MGSENGATAYSGLLVDYGKILTTNLFNSFQSFCELEEIEPNTINRRFHENRTYQQLLIKLKTGKLPKKDFEPQFAKMLGVDPKKLIDQLFTGSTPDKPMVKTILTAHQKDIHTNLISNS